MDHALANVSSFAGTYARFIRDLDRARNVEDITSKVLQYLSQFGVEHRCFGDPETGRRTGGTA